MIFTGLFSGTLMGHPSRERLTFQLIRRVEHLGYHVATWQVSDRQELRASKGETDMLLVRVQGHDEQAMYKAAVQLASMVGIDVED